VAGWRPSGDATRDSSERVHGSGAKGPMTIRAATEDELGQLVTLQQIVFRPGEEGAGERYWSYVREDPRYRLEHSRVVEDGGRIVAYLRVWDRRIRLRGSVVRAGGIGSLATHPDHRGKGYASALLRDTEQYFTKSGYDIGLLFTIIGTPFYEARGWVSVPLPTFEILPKDEPSRSDAGSGVRCLNVGDDLHAVARVYESHCSGVTGSEVREPSYWTSGPARMRGVFPQIGYGPPGELQAYVNRERRRDGLWVKEACGVGGRQVWRSLASALWAEAAESGGGRIAGSLPRAHPLIAALQELAHAEATLGTHDEMMVKIANREALRRKLAGAAGRWEMPPEGEDERGFWHELLGVTDVGPGDVHYWWTDIY